MSACLCVFFPLRSVSFTLTLRPNPIIAPLSASSHRLPLPNLPPISPSPSAAPSDPISLPTPPPPQPPHWSPSSALPPRGGRRVAGLLRLIVSIGVAGGGRSSRSMETLTDSIRVDARLNKRPVAPVARGRRSDSPSSDTEESEESSPRPARPCRLLFDRRWEASMFGRHLRPTLSRLAPRLSATQTELNR